MLFLLKTTDVLQILKKCTGGYHRRPHISSADSEMYQKPYSENITGSMLYRLQPNETMMSIS